MRRNAVDEDRVRALLDDRSGYDAVVVDGNRLSPAHLQVVERVLQVQRR